MFSSHVLAIIVLLPLIGFLISGIFGNFLINKYGEKIISFICCALPILSFILSILVFIKLPAEGISEHLYSWASSINGIFELELYMDKLSGLMALIVTGVGSLIHIYSIGYMHKDKSYARFFSYMNLFLFFMLLLVLGQSLLVLFVGWEGVGLVSYLLIGFWYENSDFANAGKKAFIFNRIGDAAFLLGMFLLVFSLNTLDIPTINNLFSSSSSISISPTLTAVIALLLFIGATGKSAQIPLYTWLPDAMAGPTPVSALIHAATMVTAGVYMVVRLAPLFLSAIEIMNIIAVIGALTSLLAATIAITQTDIKKVLAYSTVSQLGLMFTAAGVGAFGVAIFHLFTHAFFKACLFLSAGNVIHSMSNEQDILKMGALWKKIPITFLCFVIAAAAIAGLPPLSGFFSKDEILWVAFASNMTGSNGGGHWGLWLIISIASFFTSFYMFRLVWLVFFGKARYSKKVEKNLHESPNSMILVIVALALCSIFAGFVHIPEFLANPISVHESIYSYEIYFIIFATFLAIVGLILAKLIYGTDLSTGQNLKNKFEQIHILTTNKFYVDELYDWAIATPYKIISEICQSIIDNLINKILHVIVNSVKACAHVLVKIQNGNLQLYLLLVLTGIMIIMIWSTLG